MEVKVTKDNFVEEVLNSKKPVVIDFWASWCGPCRMLAPELTKFAEKNQEKIKVVKINVDEEYELAVKYNVVSIPMLVKVENGNVVKTAVGYMNEDEIENNFA